MAQKSILLPMDIALRFHIALLERENAQLQARILAQQMDYQHERRIYALLADGEIRLPVPLAACQFNAEHGVLFYEEQEEIP